MQNKNKIKKSIPKSGISLFDVPRTLDNDNTPLESLRGCGGIGARPLVLDVDALREGNVADERRDEAPAEGGRESGGGNDPDASNDAGEASMTGVAGAD